MFIERENVNELNQDLTDVEDGQRDNDEHKKIALLVSLIINRLFNNQTLLIRNLHDVNDFLIRLIDTVKHAQMNLLVCSGFLCNSLFSMIYNLIELKLQSDENKYLDLCILNDLADCLINYIGKTNKINTVLFNFPFIFPSITR